MSDFHSLPETIARLEHAVGSGKLEQPVELLFLSAAHYLHRLTDTVSAYTCNGCGKPILLGQEMMGSDVFCIYAHAGACEALAQQQMRGQNDETQKADTHQGE